MSKDLTALKEKLDNELKDFVSMFINLTDYDELEFLRAAKISEGRQRSHRKQEHNIIILEQNNKKGIVNRFLFDSVANRCYAYFRNIGTLIVKARYADLKGLINRKLDYKVLKELFDIGSEQPEQFSLDKAISDFENIANEQIAIQEIDDFFKARKKWKLAEVINGIKKNKSLINDCQSFTNFLVENYINEIFDDFYICLDLLEDIGITYNKKFQEQILTLLIAVEKSQPKFATITNSVKTIVR